MKKSKPPLFAVLHLRDGRKLLVHTGKPAFVALVIVGDGPVKLGEIRWIDSPLNFDDRTDALLRRAVEWYQHTQIEKHGKGD